jgi:hypothetical protein
MRRVLHDRQQVGGAGEAEHAHHRPPGGDDAEPGVGGRGLAQRPSKCADAGRVAEGHRPQVQRQKCRVLAEAAADLLAHNLGRCEVNVALEREDCPAAHPRRDDLQNRRGVGHRRLPSPGATNQHNKDHAAADTRQAIQANFFM